MLTSTVLLLSALLAANFVCQAAPLFNSPISYNNNGQQPLMESSLEQTIDDADQHLPENTPSFEAVEFSEEESFGDNQSAAPGSDSYEATREETDEKIYDLLLKILQILDDQAHRDAERARRLETLRGLNPVPNEHPRDDDEDSGEVYARSD